MADFVYDNFSQYSGIDFGLVRPGDSLAQDLAFRTACYGDWDLDLFDDVKETFGVDIRTCPLSEATTVSDWVRQLTKCIKQ